MMKRIQFGKVHAHYLTMAEAVEAVVMRAKDKKGGFVVTPNVDHIVMAEKNEALQRAYADAALSLADGKPLIWMSRLAGFPLPEKVSGSDLIRPLLRRAAEEGLSVYFLGSAPGVGATAAAVLCQEIPALKVAGIDAPPPGFEKDPEQEKSAREKMLGSAPDIVLFALGAPKQELLMHRWQTGGSGPMMLGIGAGLDFIAGKVKRSPPWMSQAGLEWLYRLSQDPKRLARRYLIQDPQVIPVFYRMMKTPKPQRISGFDQATGRG